MLLLDEDLFALVCQCMYNSQKVVQDASCFNIAAIQIVWRVAHAWPYTLLHLHQSCILMSYSLMCYNYERVWLRFHSNWFSRFIDLNLLSFDHKRWVEYHQVCIMQGCILSLVVKLRKDSQCKTYFFEEHSNKWHNIAIETFQWYPVVSQKYYKSKKQTQ